MDRPFIYKDVDLVDFQVHIRHLAENLRSTESFEINIKDIGIEFSLIKNSYKVKPTTLSLLIRTSDVGRNKLYELHSWLLTEPYTIKVRKSQKKKYINQVKIIWDTSDSFYPADIVSALNKICSKLGGVWPPSLLLGYYSYKMSYKNLPGKLVVDSLFWKAGYAVGLAISKIVK